MKHLKFTCFVVLFLFFSSDMVWSQQLIDETPPDLEKPTSDFALAIGIKANTLGLGGEVAVQFMPKLQLRLGGTYTKYSVDLKQYSEEIEGSGDFTTGGISLLANYHLAKSFFLSGGAIYTFADVTIHANSAKPVTVGDVVVEPIDVGMIDINIKPKLKVMPYLGFGVGRTISKDGVVSFAFEMGAAYLDSPKTILNTTGMLEPTSSPEQQQQFEENLSWIYIYPVMSFQLSFRIL
ncbi:MAG: hypothetical protein Q8T08_16295 [Ignavibacteria bacterium]|nr:hypothetical protein [Ignavibacteria bacterium]